MFLHFHGNFLKFYFCFLTALVSLFYATFLVTIFKQWLNVLALSFVRQVVSGFRNWCNKHFTLRRSMIVYQKDGSCGWTTCLSFRLILKILWTCWLSERARREIICTRVMTRGPSGYLWDFEHTGQKGLEKGFVISSIWLD